MTQVIIRCVDFETTTLHRPDAQICEMALTDVLIETDPRSVKEIGAAKSRLFDVDGPMPPEACAIHHLQKKHLAGQPLCTDVDVQLLIDDISDHGITPAFIAAHNFEMEGQWLTPEAMGETRAICTMKCAGRIWPEAPSKSLSALRYWLDLDLDEERANPPHRAGPDTWVTAHLLAKMLETHKVVDLVKFTLMPRFFPTCPIGEHKGRAWGEVPHSYLVWMVDKAKEMDPDTKAAAQDELFKRRQAKP